MTKRSLFVWVGLFIFLGTFARAQSVIRVGAFPNMTHPQAMVGKSNGWFEKAMGPQVKVEWKSFNAGPSAIEALFAGAIDMTYIGPNPAISGYVRSNGEALRIVAGATSGGAALVVRNDSGIQKPEDFHGLGGIHQRSAQRIVSRRHAPESFIQNGVRQRFSRFFRDLPVEKFFCLRQVPVNWSGFASGITCTSPPLSGKKIASPQMGNTQDVALRAWLASAREIRAGASIAAQSKLQFLKRIAQSIGFLRPDT